MKKIRVCFLGTPEFAAEHLRVLLNNQTYQVVGVVTQPDRPAGRKMQLTASAVKILAQKNGLQILTPQSLRKDLQSFEIIKSWKADVAVVVAFGQILSQEFLDSFQFGAVNIHGSLLPLYRGAAPIQRCLENGDKVTGVSLQKMVYKLDAGPIIAEKKISLNSEINATELYNQLSILGCELLNNELSLYVENKIKLTEQDETRVTIAHKISKEESLLDFNLSAEKIHNKVRAFSMGPGTHVFFHGQRLKIHKTQVVQTAINTVPGQIIEVNSEALVIQCGLNSLSLLDVQPESKPKMQIKEFLKTVSLKSGELFL
jgi:methionyl-tRNA formyltransferase